MTVDKSKLKIPEINPVDLNSLPIKLPKIEIDQSKCTVPFWCKKCLEACPHLVFWVDNVRIERGKEADPREPGVYKLIAVRRDKCTLCNRCVEVCPEGAITITYDGNVYQGVKTADTQEEAKKSPYPLFAAPASYSFELNEDMIALLRQEFDPAKIVAKFAQAIAGKQKDEVANEAKEIFSEYGREWMKKVLQLGEEYSDRTYDLLKEVIDETGEFFFPHVPQRFIEIAYLSTQQFLKLPILENYRQRLLYQVPDCYTFRQLKEHCGSEIAEPMPCKHACLSGLEAMCRDLDLDVTIDMEAETAKDGYCQFRITNV